MTNGPLPPPMPGPASPDPGSWDHQNRVSAGPPKAGLSAVRVRDYGFILALAAVLGVAVLDLDTRGVSGFSELSWLVALGALVAFGLRWYDASEHAKAEARRRREVSAQSYLATVDAMSGPDFERYVAAMLELAGHQDVQVVGGRGDGGVDVLTTSPSGMPMAYQCKRQRDRVPVGVVRGLLGSLTHEHRGREGVIVTSAGLTRDAWELARSSGIAIIDRNDLADWMIHVRQTATEAESEPPAPDRPTWRRPGVPALTLSCAAAVIAVLALFYRPSPPHPQPRADIAPVHHEAAHGGPAAVVRANFAAINSHDWHKLWNLWQGHLPARGPRYRAMIAGYRLTARDVVTGLKTNGNSVTAHVRAYETTGAIQVFVFHFKIHDGRIAPGSSSKLLRVIRRK